MKKKKSWKTTLGGILGGLGTILATSPGVPGKYQAIGAAMAAIAVAWLGWNARDDKVSSEDAGAK